MMSSSVTSSVILVILCASSTSAAELPNGSRWTAAANGAIPAGAFALGHEPDGRPQYLCKSALGGGVVLGKLVSSSPGCAISSNGREVLVSSYEVLGASLGTAPNAIAEAKFRAPATARANLFKGQLAGKLPAAAQTDIGSDGAMRRGFDDTGQPFIEERKPDGRVLRKTRNGIQILNPDGTQSFVPVQHMLSNAPMPTPPELPSDPARGRAWLERHNDALLEVISRQVRQDQSEMQKFTGAEKKDAGNDVFRQILFRTRVLSFLAQDN